MKADAVVIGNGLIGGMITKYLKTVKGLDVIVIDNKNPMGASKCSFGVWKEGWVNKIIKPEYEDGLDLLDTFCGGIEEIKFKVKPKPYRNLSVVDKYRPELVNKEEFFKRVDCSLLLNEKALDATVLSIEGNRVTILKNNTGKKDDKDVIVSNLIVVAAGVWTTDILIENGFMENLPYLDRLWGCTLSLKGNATLKLPESQIREWAPYKQSVFVNLGNERGVYGDGATLKNPKANDERLAQVSDRIIVHMNDLLNRDIVDGQEKYGTKRYSGAVVEINEGYRPYLNKQKSTTKKFVNQHSKFVYSATGGAKNSTILAGHMAKELWRIYSSNR